MKICDKTVVPICDMGRPHPCQPAETGSGVVVVVQAL
jgi:hypothetical protein